MTHECRWLTANWESYFEDGWEGSNRSRADAHLLSCEACRKELEGFRRVDVLTRAKFRRDLSAAGRPHAYRLRPAAVALAVVPLLAVALLLRPAVQDPLPAVSIVGSGPAAPATVEKSQTPPEVARAKPAPGYSAAPVPPTEIPLAPDPAGVPAEFSVVDHAGYTRTLEDYRGHVAAIALLDPDDTEGVAQFEALYSGLGGDPAYRFLAVMSRRTSRPPNSTFPIAFDQGSKVLGLAPGEVVIVDRSGKLVARQPVRTGLRELRNRITDTSR